MSRRNLSDLAWRFELATSRNWGEHFTTLLPSLSSCICYYTRITIQPANTIDVIGFSLVTVETLIKGKKSLVVFKALRKVCEVFQTIMNGVIDSYGVDCRFALFTSSFEVEGMNVREFSHNETSVDLDGAFSR